MLKKVFQFIIILASTAGMMKGLYMISPGLMVFLGSIMVLAIVLTEDKVTEDGK